MDVIVDVHVHTPVTPPARERCRCGRCPPWTVRGQRLHAPPAPRPRPARAPALAPPRPRPVPPVCLHRLPVPLPSCPSRSAHHRLPLVHFSARPETCLVTETQHCLTVPPSLRGSALFTAIRIVYSEQIRHSIRRANPSRLPRHATRRVRKTAPTARGAQLKAIVLRVRRAMRLAALVGLVAASGLFLLWCAVSLVGPTAADGDSGGVGGGGRVPGDAVPRTRTEGNILGPPARFRGDGTRIDCRVCASRPGDDAECPARQPCGVEGVYSLRSDWRCGAAAAAAADNLESLGTRASASSSQHHLGGFAGRAWLISLVTS